MRLIRANYRADASRVPDRGGPSRSGLVPGRASRILFLVAQVGDSRPQRVEGRSLMHQLPIGKADWRDGGSRHWRRGDLPLRMSGASGFASKPARSAGPRHRAVPAGRGHFPGNAELPGREIRHVEGEALALEMAGQDPAGMLFSALASATVFADATTAAQAEGAERGGPEGGRVGLEPTLDIGGRFGFVLHAMYMAYILSKKKIMLQSVEPLIWCGISNFAAETSLV